MLTSQCTTLRLLFDSFNQVFSLGRMNHNDGKGDITLCCHDHGVRPSPYISEEAMMALWKEIESVHEQAGLRCGLIIGPALGSQLQYWSRPTNLLGGRVWP